MNIIWITNQLLISIFLFILGSFLAVYNYPFILSLGSLLSGYIWLLIYNIDFCKFCETKQENPTLEK